MARVTEYFNLGTTQSGVDFVDVDVTEDVPVFIDPASLRAQTGDWADSCIASIQSYFEELLRAIRADDTVRIRELIAPMQEPNETHLGLSRGQSRGRSLGTETKARELIENLRRSKAAASGMLRDLEDTALLVDGIDRDIISDITTCIIRTHLIDYTQVQCRFYGIALETQEAGPMWDSKSRNWDDKQFKELPRVGDNKLLLIPKSIVRVKLSVDKGRYYRGYLRPYYEDIELKRANSQFVEILKNKRRKVRKGKLDEALGTRKPDIIRHTERFPDALASYKEALDAKGSRPLPDDEVSARIGTDSESLDEMLQEILIVPPGKVGANAYHRAVAKFLTLLFDTQLANEHIETKLHGELKRIDITYDNVAGQGFFDWLRKNFPAATIVVECKNYGKEVGNPEFDQIGMRFAPTRGQFGLLVCRDLADEDRARARAKAIADDGHGYVVVLTDDDLRKLVDDVRGLFGGDPERYAYPLLRQRFRALLGLAS